ncbi:hypothetical protein SBDP1_680065 [Syntrophobacter sp. SbD1]|nr:hypothetical protein SBDP1_680065 [Syntrophobacter sp. SbD1]
MVRKDWFLSFFRPLATAFSRAPATGHSDLTRAMVRLRELMPSVLKEHGELLPAFDIAEADDHSIVKADLPGIEPKSLDISLSGNVFTIRGEKKEEREEKNERYYTVERQFGSFSRTFMLLRKSRKKGLKPPIRMAY